MEGAQQFIGKWKQDRSENMDDFLKEMGMNFIFRKMANKARPEQHVTIEENIMTITTCAGFITKVNTVKLNGELETEEDGVKIKCTSTWEDGKLITTQDPIDPSSKKKKITVHRQLVDGEVEQTMYIGNVIAKRWFKKME